MKYFHLIVFICSLVPSISYNNLFFSSHHYGFLADGRLHIYVPCFTNFWFAKHDELICLYHPLVFAGQCGVCGSILQSSILDNKISSLLQVSPLLSIMTWMSVLDISVPIDFYITSATGSSIWFELSISKQEGFVVQSLFIDLDIEKHGGDNNTLYVGIQDHNSDSIFIDDDFDFFHHYDPLNTQLMPYDTKFSLNTGDNGGLGSNMLTLSLYEAGPAAGSQLRLDEVHAKLVFFEVVLNESEFNRSQSFFVAASEAANPYFASLRTCQIETTPVADTTSTSTSGTINVLNVFGGLFDGQKKIMSELWESSVLAASISFSLLWVCEDPRLPCRVDPSLGLVNIPVRILPALAISDKDFDERVDGREETAFTTIRQLSTSNDALYLYIFQRFKAAHYNIEQVQPMWVRRTWQHFAMGLGDAIPDVIVIGNTGYAADAMIPAVALALGATAVVIDIAASLARPHLLVPYSAVISPSTYALCEFKRMYMNEHSDTHRMCLNNLKSSHGDKVVSSCPSLSFVVPPGTGPVSGGLSHVPTCPPQCQFLPADSPRMYRCNPSCLVVGFVGRLVKMKSPGMFLLAAKDILSRNNRAVSFLIVGNGPLLGPLKHLSRRLGIHRSVHFFGQASQRQLPSLYAAMDIIINPSMSANETFCMVNLEAMMHAVPVVSFGSYGQGEYLDHPGSAQPNAGIVTSLSVSAIADEAEKLLSNRSYYKAIQLRAVSTAAQYSRDAAAIKYNNAIRQVYLSFLSEKQATASYFNEM